MSRLTNYAENKLVDFTRGQGLTLPTNWTIHLLSAASDSAQTKLAGTGYAGQPYARSLPNWAGTQGEGTTLASNGTSHATSNNNAIPYGTAGAAWGTWAYIGIYDDSDNCWMYAQLPAPIVINNGDPVSIDIGGIAFTLGLTGGCSNYLSNKLIDLLFRAQIYTWPATSYHGLLTAAPSNAGGGTDVATGSYARVAYANTLTNWSSTQGDTSASTGTGGASSNLAALIWPAPTANWGTVGWETENDASMAGNLLFWAPLNSAVTVSSGASAPRISSGGAVRTFQ